MRKMFDVRCQMLNVRRLQATLVVLGVSVVLPGCWSPKPSTLDPEIKMFAEAANASYQRGEVERADGLYGKALQRARLSDNREEIARNAYNLALCRIVEGKWVEAKSLLTQARVLMGGQGAEVARVLLAEAEVARLSGATAESDQLAGLAVDKGADREGRTQASLLKGEDAFVSGQTLSALGHYRAARSGVTRQSPALIRARLDGLAAHLIQVELLDGDVGGVQLERAEWLKRSGQFKDMAEALNAAATDFEQDGKYVEAFDCQIRAAQSLLAAGNREVAKQAAAHAAALAEKTGNANHKVLVAGVMDDLK